MLDDEYLLGIRTLLACPNAILFFIFIVLTCLLRNFTFDVLRKLIFPITKMRFRYYNDVEDKLFMEEFEDPD